MTISTIFILNPNQYCEVQMYLQKGKILSVISDWCCGFQFQQISEILRRLRVLKRK